METTTCEKCGLEQTPTKNKNFSYYEYACTGCGVEYNFASGLQFDYCVEV